MSKGLKGALVFINSQTREKISVPAVAVYQKRQVQEKDNGISQRFAVRAYFAHIDEVGYWDEVQKKVSYEKALEGSKWLAVSFRLNDPNVSKVLEQEVSSLMASVNDQSGSTDKRIRRVRLDEWARGWMFDLCYEPFQGIANSAKKILQLEEAGAIKLDSENELIHWLNDQVKAYGTQANDTSLATPHSVYEQTPDDTTSMNNPQASLDAPTEGQTESLMGMASQATIDAAQKVLLDPMQVFVLDPNMKSFDSLALFSAEQMRSGRRAVFANEKEEKKDEAVSDTGQKFKTIPNSGENQKNTSFAKSSQNKAQINFQIIRLPLVTSDRINWNEALFKPTQFVDKELFDVLKHHWKATHQREDGKESSLYSIDALLALSDKGIRFSIDNKEPQERHIHHSSGRVDPERLALFALSQNSNWSLAQATAQHAASLALERSIQTMCLQQKQVEMPMDSVRWETLVSARVGSSGLSHIKWCKTPEHTLVSVPNFQADGVSVYMLDEIAEQKFNYLKEQQESTFRKVQNLGFLHIDVMQKERFLDQLTDPSVKEGIKLRERFYQKRPGIKNSAHHQESSTKTVDSTNATGMLPALNTSALQANINDEKKSKSSLPSRSIR